MPELAFQRHGQELLRVALADHLTVGRAPECDLVIPDPTLSRLQAVVERRGGGYWLVDRSGRGTALGEATVQEAPLTDGAAIQFGTWQAIFRTRSPGPAPTTQAGDATAVRAPDLAPIGGAAALRVRSSGLERRVALDRAALTIGKAPDNDLVLDDPFVSNRHARLDRSGGRWWVTDLVSTNGTLLSGARVSHGELLPGAVLGIGGAELAFELVPSGRGPQADCEFEGIVSGDPGMRQIFEIIDRVAGSDVPVAILGETGTGKELVARAIHARSLRPQGPFVVVNCSAVAAGLTESEFFGHSKGAFTGALRDQEGLFAAADGGTLFLDEVGELALELQPKLLRALESGEVRPVGSSQSMQVSARIVAATNRDLRGQVGAGKFRDDLYYRLSVFPIHLPPLRSRRGDVRLLAERFLARIAPPALGIRWSEDALSKLEGHAWPGNVRQLRNVVQRALLLRGAGPVLGAELVVFDAPGCEPVHRKSDHDALQLEGLSLAEVEREAIRLALRRHRGSRAAVVKELGISKTTLLRKIAEWGLQDEGRQGAAADADPDGEE